LVSFCRFSCDGFSLLPYYDRRIDQGMDGSPAFVVRAHIQSDHGCRALLCLCSSSSSSGAPYATELRLASVAASEIFSLDLSKTEAARGMCCGVGSRASVGLLVIGRRKKMHFHLLSSHLSFMPDFHLPLESFFCCVMHFDNAKYICITFCIARWAQPNHCENYFSRVKSSRMWRSVFQLFTGLFLSGLVKKQASEYLLHRISRNTKISLNCIASFYILVIELVLTAMCINLRFNSHKWTVYARSATNEDLSVIVKRAVFQLHPSFHNPTRVVEQLPFELSESGWGEFEIAITLYFHSDACEKRLDLQVAQLLF
jgi:hypothetical protein